MWGRCCCWGEHVLRVHPDVLCRDLVHNDHPPFAIMLIVLILWGYLDKSDSLRHGPPQKSESDFPQRRLRLTLFSSRSRFCKWSNKKVCGCKDSLQTVYRLLVWARTCMHALIVQKHNLSRKILFRYRPPNSQLWEMLSWWDWYKLGNAVFWKWICIDVPWLNILKRQRSETSFSFPFRHFVWLRSGSKMVSWNRFRHGHWYWRDPLESI